MFLVVFSILAEAPHDVSYFWRYVLSDAAQLPSSLPIFVLRMRSWTDFGLMSLTFITSILWNVEVGIVCSIVFSLLLVVHKSSKPPLTILVSRSNSMHSEGSLQVVTILPWIGEDSWHEEMETRQ